MNQEQRKFMAIVGRLLWVVPISIALINWPGTGEDIGIIFAWVMSLVIGFGVVYMVNYVIKNT